jgi:hypothetical protein
MIFGRHQGRKRLRLLALNRALKEHRAMKLTMGWAILAGLLVASPAAIAQVSAPRHSGQPSYTAVSDFEGPYAAMPEPMPAPVFVPRYGPTLLPLREVYTVVRESGFSPLGPPRQRGLVYMISVVDRDGEDGRLVIDARTGRILNFMPAYRMGGRLNDAMTPYGPVDPPVGSIGSGPRPPASIPHVSNRRDPVPLPKAAPPQTSEANPETAKPALKPAQRSAAVDPKPGGAQTGMQTSLPPAIEAKRAAPQILPTQEMPKVQALD